jgi:hypothetical protein
MKRRELLRTMAAVTTVPLTPRCLLGVIAGLIGILSLSIASGLLAAPARGAENTSSPEVSSPAWTKDLIIYSIAPKGFTSPNGPESGTFNGLKDKMPYLEKLGINSIWLTGHSLAPPHLFFNIWSQYGNIEPDKIGAK